MRSAAPVNADPDKPARVDTNAMPWERTEHPGVWRKVLEFVSHPKKGRETSLLKFEPGASLPTETLVDRLDIFVIEGAYSDGHGDYGQHTFIHRIEQGPRSHIALCLVAVSRFHSQLLCEPFRADTSGWRDRQLGHLWDVADWSRSLRGEPRL